MSPTYQLRMIFLLLLLMCCCCSIHTTAKLNPTVPCLADEASALLQLKRSFHKTNLSSWQIGTDCCHWEGISCDMASGRVIALDLSDHNFWSTDLDPALFNLTSLQNLSLGGNDFRGARIPTFGFERLTEIVHLDLSYTNFVGQIPIVIARLKKLVVLDFTSYEFTLYLEEPSFETFISNLSNIRELYLDNVDISSSGANWSIALVNFVPRLQILSLSSCSLSGFIHQSMSQFHSLSVVSLGGNDISGKVPEFFANFSFLHTLDLSFNDFEGQLPINIFRLKNLRSLDVSWNSMLSVHIPNIPVGNNLETLSLCQTKLSGDIPISFVNLKSLKYLCLSTIRISNDLPSLIDKLPSLDEIELYGSNLEKPNLSWIGNLKHLTSLVLESYKFSGPIPSCIGNLTSLTRLELRNCDLSGSLPSSVGKLMNLTRLKLEGCNFSGSVPSMLGNLTNLETLTVTDCNFSGPIPSWIGNLTQLVGLDFNHNSLYGKIPKSLFALPALETVDLSGNQLTGSLEDIDNPLFSSLSYIDLSDNQLSGSIPKSYFKLTRLQVLFLEINQLTGIVKLNTLWRLQNLVALGLAHNMLSVIDGEDDPRFSLAPNIKGLNLESCNLTKLPGMLRYMHGINVLQLSSNHITGVIPSWIWENGKDSLNCLNLSHNMFTSLEKSPLVVPMRHLAILDLSFNSLEGNVPIPLVESPIRVSGSYAASTLDYANNNFNFIAPSFGRYLRTTVYLNLSNNRLNSIIPLSICTASELQILDLSYNNFSGFVPPCLIEGGTLSILKLRENQLHGTLPEIINEGCMLQTIDLNNNRIEGKLPRSVSNCQNLRLLDVGYNQIVDLFPSWLGILPKFRVLVLRSNKFHGSIRGLQGGDQIGNHFSSLQILDLASNSFSGKLHSKWFMSLKSMMANVNNEGQVLKQQTNSSINFYQDIVTVTFKGRDSMFTKILTTFRVIDLSSNSFDGVIPKSIGRLISLHGFNISHNVFTGEIPSQLGALTHLESLDLSSNQLSGEIPQELTSLTSLAWLNLSYNNLTGRIPENNQFLTFPNSSFEGNVGLCGLQLSKKCDISGSTTPSTSASLEQNSWWQDKVGVVLMFLFVGLGFGVGFSIAIMFRLLCPLKRWNCKHYTIHI